MRRTNRSIVASAVVLAALNAVPRANAADEQDRPHRNERTLRPIAPRRGAYLGVSALPAGRALGRQLGLPEGVGLVVDAVVPDSPAAEAGLREDDLLHRLNDQLLINSEQLAVLVRTFKPGDEVKLSIIRDGKPQTLTARLAEHELMPLGRGEDSFRDWLPFRGGPLDLPRPNLPPENNSPRPPQTHVPSPREQRPGANDSVLTWIDRDRTYTITTHNGHQSISVNEKGGATIFQGPIDTQEERDRVPTDVRDRLEKMRHSGLLQSPNQGPQERTSDQRQQQDAGQRHEEQ